jgi:molybdopterin-binding protein
LLDTQALHQSCLLLSHKTDAHEVLKIDRTSQFEEMLTPREAAVRLGISYPTVKKWILNGTMISVRTPGGHHRIPRSTINQFLNSDQRPAPQGLETAPRIPGINHLTGDIVSLRSEGLMSELVLDVGGSKVVAVITTDTVEELALKVGDNATALIKWTDVMIASIR